MDENLRPIKKSEMKEWFPEMALNIDTIDIYLTIRNFEFNPDLITEKTKLEPNDIIKKGQKYIKKSGKEWISEYNEWSVMYEQKNATYSDDAINGFVNNIVNPNKEYFKEILVNAEGILEFVYYYYYSNNIGIAFNKEFVNILSELNLKVEFDLYCLHEDEKK
jgi:hypothetical protein